jgi:transcriptional regulator with XRE-family HTH domain
MKEEVRLNIEKALKLRKEENLTYSEIGERMGRPIGTVKRWLAPYDLGISSNGKKSLKNGSAKGSAIVKNKFFLLRQEVYEATKNNVVEDLQNNLLRDFINIYIGEGNKRNRTRLSIVNSDQKIILLSLFIIKKYFLKENKKINLEIRYYKENNNEKELLDYWKKITNNDPVITYKTYIQPTVKALGHNNSNKFGLVVVYINDTYAKQKLEAYMDYLKEEWVNEFEKTFNVEFDHSIKEVKSENIVMNLVSLNSDQDRN